MNKVYLLLVLSDKKITFLRETKQKKSFFL